MRIGYGAHTLYYLLRYWSCDSIAAACSFSLSGARSGPSARVRFMIAMTESKDIEEDCGSEDCVAGDGGTMAGQYPADDERTNG